MKTCHRCNSIVLPASGEDVGYLRAVIAYLVNIR